MEYAQAVTEIAVGRFHPLQILPIQGFPHRVVLVFQMNMLSGRSSTQFLHKQFAIMDSPISGRLKTETSLLAAREIKWNAQKVKCVGRSDESALVLLQKDFQALQIAKYVQRKGPSVDRISVELTTSWIAGIGAGPLNFGNGKRFWRAGPLDS
jgi:hypothetical protein